jgi:hypothetical protein
LRPRNRVGVTKNRLQYSVADHANLISQKAARASDPSDKRAWLRLAETWQALTRLSEDVRSLIVINPSPKSWQVITALVQLGSAFLICGADIF